MTRVLLLHQPVDGGVGRHVRDLFDGLSARGHDVRLAGPSIPSGSAFGHQSAATDPDVHEAHTRLEMVRAINPRIDLVALTHYLRLVRAERPELVHAHSSKAGALARLGRLFHPSVPVVYSPHGYAFAGFFERRWERALYREAERALAPLASMVVAVCEAEARLARTLGPARRVRVVHNGIDLAARAGDDRCDRRPDGDRLLNPVLCAVSRLQPSKGLEVLIDAMPAVVERYPTARLTVAGGGPLAGALRDRARARGLQDRVVFLGDVPDTGRVLSDAQAFVLPSLAESFPYVILEAMAAEMPIVASDVGGVSEAVISGESGLLVSPADPSALSEAMLAVLDDPQLGRRLGAAAGARVGRQFSRDAMIDRLVSVYDEVLDRAGGDRPAASG